jgi:hypothetical protein
MTTNKTLAVFGLAAVLALAVATTLSSSAYAVSDKWTQSCTGPEDPQGPPGECAGGSERSGPHDEQLRNHGGNLPPGQQEDDD